MSKCDKTDCGCVDRIFVTGEYYCAICKHNTDARGKHRLDYYNPPPKAPIQTNGDKIRVMTNAELAKAISQTGCGLCCSLGIRNYCREYRDDSCENVITAWLNKPVEEV